MSMASSATATCPYRRVVEERRRKPAYIQRCGDFFLPDGSEVSVGRVQLLPDTCIVKIPERHHWSDDAQALTTRMFGVYALNRRLHVHLCELCPSYELWSLETQYEETDEVAADENKRDELNQIIIEGDGQTEPVVYMHVADIEPLFRRGRRCPPGRLPKNERGGGFPASRHQGRDLGRCAGRDFRIAVQRRYLIGLACWSAVCIRRKSTEKDLSMFFVHCGSAEFGGELFGSYDIQDEAAAAIGRLAISGLTAYKKDGIVRSYRIIEAKGKVAAEAQIDNDGTDELGWPPEHMEDDLEGRDITGKEEGYA